MSNGKKVHGRVAAAHGKAHSTGFDEALEEALAQASKELGPGTHDVVVEFGAEVHVTNPGSIGFYSVTLTKQ